MGHPILATTRRAVLDAIALLLPVTCAGCGAPDRSVCPECVAALRASPRQVERGDLVVWAALEYEGVAANAIRACKDAARTDAAAPLAWALGAAIRAALDDLPGLAAGTVEVCTVPSTPAAMRRRGYAPVDALLARCGIRASPVLRLVRARRDQAGLGVAARRANAQGALEARTRLRRTAVPARRRRAHDGCDAHRDASCRDRGRGLRGGRRRARGDPAAPFGTPVRFSGNSP